MALKLQRVFSFNRGELTMSRKVLCFEGKKLDTKLRGIIVKRNGDPTDLYYHIQECEECEKLRSENC